MTTELYAEEGPKWRREDKHLKANEIEQDGRELVFVHGGVGAFHFGSELMSSSDLDQRTDSDSGATMGRPLPFGGTLQELRPEREQATLGGLGRVDGATLCDQEMALLLFGFSKTEQVAGAVNVAALKLGGGEVEKAGGLTEILLGEIDVALDIAATSASALARKPHALHAGQDNLKSTGCAGGS